MITDGCFIEAGARVESSVLSPGVIVRPGAVVRESILLTDCIVESGTVVERAILDKRVRVGQNARIGGGVHQPDIRVAIVGKNSTLPANIVVEPGAEVGTDLIPEDFESLHVKVGQTIQTNRKPYEI
jgi:glucose-1-phosphate adenylyltransferase